MIVQLGRRSMELMGLGGCPTPLDDSACTELGGVCKNKSKETCAGKWQSCLCAGAADRVCCIEPRSTSAVDSGTPTTSAGTPGDCTCEAKCKCSGASFFKKKECEYECYAEEKTKELTKTVEKWTSPEKVEQAAGAAVSYIGQQIHKSYFEDDRPSQPPPSQPPPSQPPPSQPPPSQPTGRDPNIDTIILFYDAFKRRMMRPTLTLRQAEQARLAAIRRAEQTRRAQSLRARQVTTAGLGKSIPTIALALGGGVLAYALYKQLKKK